MTEESGFMDVLDDRDWEIIFKEIYAGEWKPKYIENLEFYENSELAVFEKDGKAARFLTVGAGPLETRKWFMLRGTTADISDANDAGKLELTSENVIMYLGFYCRMLRVGNECLYITDAYADTVPGADRARVVEERDDGSFIITATVLHPDSLHAARFEVSEHGDVDVIEERPLATFPARN